MGGWVRVSGCFFGAGEGARSTDLLIESCLHPAPCSPRSPNSDGSVRALNRDPGYCACPRCGRHHARPGAVQTAIGGSSGGSTWMAWTLVGNW